MQAITQSLSDGLGAILGALPALIGALIILVIGFIIAKVLQGIVTRVLQSMGFEGWMEQGGIIVFAAFAAPTQLGIGEELIAPTFLILLGSGSRAAAIAFGLGRHPVA